MPKPGPGNGCLKLILLINPNDFPKILTSSLKKSFKGSIGYKKDQKKAIVTLSEGNSIDSSLEIK